MSLLGKKAKCPFPSFNIHMWQGKFALFYPELFCVAYLFPQFSLGWIIPALFFSFVFSVCTVRLSSVVLRNLSQCCLISFVLFCVSLYHISHCVFICHMVHVMTAHLSASQKMHVCKGWPPTCNPNCLGLKD
uniref:Uncharacterized protein n=1 Tax=Spermophilus dauricus TaxID=99837 RepID=A0A8C9PG93_SPEDA